MMLPKLICFIFGHVRWGKADFESDGDGGWFYTKIPLDECMRCGKAL